MQYYAYYYSFVTEFDQYIWLYLCRMQVFRAESNFLLPNEIYEIVELIKKGQIGIFPTDSVYTIACAFSSNKGIEKLCKLVGKKPSQANLSLICSDYEMMSDYVLSFPTSVFRLMKTVLPGPFTFIMKANVRKFRGYENKRHTVGIRIPDEAFLLEVIKQLGEPLVCSSLHSDDEMLQYFADVEEIEHHYQEWVDVFVDDGPGGLDPSTVVDCTGTEAVLIRQGKGIL